MYLNKLENFLSAGLILDASAAKALIEMGYQDSIGLNSFEEIDVSRSEELSDSQFCGHYIGTYIPYCSVDKVCAFRTKKNARVITQICNSDRDQVCPGMILYENRLGGKIAILPYSFTAYDADIRHLLCYQRRHILRKIITWMNPLALPVYVENPTDFLVQCWDGSKFLTVCITNLSYDSSAEIKVVFAHNTKLLCENAEYLDDKGQLNQLAVDSLQNGNNGHQVWVIRHDFAAFKPVVIRIGLC